MWWIFILYILPGIIAAFNQYIIDGWDWDVFSYSIAPFINIMVAFFTIELLINGRLKPKGEQRLNDVISFLPIALLLLIFTL